MKWTWPLGRIAGIKLQVHATFLLLVAWVAWLYYEQDPTLASVGYGLLFLAAVFAIIVVHELSHSLTARAFGVEVSSITLLPIGGVSKMESMPERPWQEFLVAVAGPAVNVVLAGVLFTWLALSWGVEALFRPEVLGGGGAFLATMVWVNVALAVFNLLPAFPMDGGRALRALLATGTDRATATRLAAYVGKGFALLFGIAGLFLNPFLVLIAVFVWLGASGEAELEQLRYQMRGLRVRSAMNTEFQVVSPDDPLERPAELLLSGFQHDFPVVQGAEVVGMLTHKDLLRALAERGRGGRVGQAMHHGVRAVHPDERLFDVFSNLQRGDCRSLPVVEAGRPVGVVTLEGIGELLMIHSALRAEPRASQPPPFPPEEDRVLVESARGREDEV